MGRFGGEDELGCYFIPGIPGCQLCDRVILSVDGAVPCRRSHSPIPNKQAEI